MSIPDSSSSPTTGGIRYGILVLTVLVAAAVLVVTLRFTRLDTDVTASLPQGAGVITDAVEIFRNHPLQNQVALDIGLPSPDRDRLVQLGREAQTYLLQSQLFDRVGFDHLKKTLPGLVVNLARHLPFYFSAKDLESKVAPRLEATYLKPHFKNLHQGLMGMRAIGQYNLIRQDPLGLREIPLRELAALAPSRKGRLYKGQLVSADGRHLLVLADPKSSGTDTAAARQLIALFADLEKRLKSSTSSLETGITVTPFGAFRAALDNETIVRRDVHKAIVLATLGISLLLCLAFPRPLLGLLALLPALVGTIAALAVTALLFRSISVMALGFGGAIISITVDHGIAYLLFLDRPHRTFGKEAAREVWAIGLLAAMTSMGAFLVLSLGGFPMFRQLGIFTALGIGFAFLFVHTIFPMIFPSLPAARRPRRQLLQKGVDRLSGLGAKGAWAALLLALVLAFWARPHFNTELRAMNTVSPATKQAEDLIKSVWGDVFNRVFLMIEADSLETLLTKSDQLAERIETAKNAQKIESGFISAKLFPGPQRLAQNHAAWQKFWSPQRLARLHNDLAPIAEHYGFKASAFASFFDTLQAAPHTTFAPPLPPSEYFELIGIAPPATDQRWRQFVGLTTGPAYQGHAFYARFSEIARVFDGALYSNRMGDLLFSTFGKMLAIIGTAVALLLLVFFRDWRLTLLALLPLVFAIICTLGTLGLLGRPLDIAALMLAIVVLGMGIDYALFLVRAFQRYGNRNAVQFRLIALSVFMASASTLIGFGVIATAQHNLLQSAGLTSFLGIGYALLGAFLILPPLLERWAHRRPRSPSGSRSSV